VKGKKILGVIRTFGTSKASILLLLITVNGVYAQTPPSEPQDRENLTPAPAGPASAGIQPEAPSNQPKAAPTPVDETSKRIERARALAAAHQLAAAATELETVRATTRDSVLRNGTSIMLMNIYLEDGNYARAQALLEEHFQARTGADSYALRSYLTLAGQAVNGVRQHLSRYRSFGVNVSNTGLPAEAVNDLDKVRLLLERMVAQAKAIIEDVPKENDGLALLEDVLGVRLALARDSRDRDKWQTEYGQARERLGFARIQLASSGEVPVLTRPVDQTNSAQALPAPEPSTQPQIAFVGLLNERAIKRVVPSYPQLARTSNVQGLVKVHVVINESGEVEVTKSEGPMLLRQAAEEAAREWRFSPPLEAGKPSKLAGYIEFNFNL